MNAIDCRGLSKWYGEVLGVQDLTLSVQGGITALVGPNGAGKSTLFRLWTGALRASQGEVLIFGENPWKRRAVLRRLGYSPEGEGVPGRLSGLSWVGGLARLSGLPAAAARSAAERSLSRVRLPPEDWRRPLSAYSNGMRQKAKLAQALAHAPDLLILDEPMSGIDPASRLEIAATLRELAREGLSVVLSSHNLPEVERLADRIALLYRGKIVASGTLREIRSLVDRYPYRIRIECEAPRELARRLALRPEVVGLSLASSGALVAETFEAQRLLGDLAGILAGLPGAVRGYWPEDERLEAVFAYLTDGRLSPSSPPPAPLPAGPERGKEGGGRGA